MQKILYVAVLLLFTVITVDAANVSNVWRRGYPLARNQMNNLRFASTMSGSSTQLTEKEEKILDRIRNAMRQGDLATVEETKKFILSRNPNSPLIRIINEEASSGKTSETSSSKNYQKANQPDMDQKTTGSRGPRTEEASSGKTSKTSSSKNYQNASQPDMDQKTTGSRGPRIRDMAEEIINIQTKINKAQEVLYNNKATLQEINDAQDQMWKLYHILNGQDALKNTTSPITLTVYNLWLSLYHKQNAYREPSEKVGDPYKTIMEQEQELDTLLNQLKLVDSYFQDPTVALMPEIRTALQTARKALQVSTYIDNNRSFLHIKSFFKNRQRTTKDLGALVEKLDALYNGLKDLKEYRNGLYQDKSLIAALQRILHDIEPSLVLLTNPQANPVEVEKLLDALRTLYSIEKALKRLHDLQPQKFEQTALDIRKLKQRAEYLSKGLEVSKGKNIFETFAQRKSKIKDILTIFENKNITLDDVQTAERNAFHLHNLAEAVDAVQNRERSEENSKILTLWNRLYTIKNALQLLEGKEFHDFIEGARFGVTQSITDIVAV